MPHARNAGLLFFACSLSMLKARLEPPQLRARRIARSRCGVGLRAIRGGRVAGDVNTFAFEPALVLRADEHEVTTTRVRVCAAIRLSLLSPYDVPGATCAVGIDVEWPAFDGPAMRECWFDCSAQGVDISHGSSGEYVRGSLERKFGFRFGTGGTGGCPPYFS